MASSSPSPLESSPEDVLRQIAVHLHAPDVLNLLASHRSIHTALGANPAFWKLLLDRDAPNNNVSLRYEAYDSMDQDKDKSQSAQLAFAKAMKAAYLTKAYINHLPSVKWYNHRRVPHLSSREGHLACVLGSGSQRKVCITGGFSDESSIHVLHAPVSARTGGIPIPPPAAAAAATPPTIEDPAWTWDRVRPSGPAGFVYGASLTPLDDTRAVRFGGFQAGGYSQETDQIAVLTVSPNTVTADGTIGSNQNHPLKATWQLITTKNPQCAAHGRAYHTATLIANRYLFIVGGMTERGSILQESILDTETWTWLEQPVLTVAADYVAKAPSARSTRSTTSQTALCKPSGRHGHSLILDEKRNRLMLFGGGSGSDLLRSGKDNSEVWELSMGNNWHTNFPASLPWTWKNVHTNTVGDEPDCDEDDEYESSSDDEEGGSNQNTKKDEAEDDRDAGDKVDAGTSGELSAPVALSPANALCLGRCHHGIKVAPDSVVLAFGSGRPSTNGVLGYDLCTDSFRNPVVDGLLPRPRFTGVAVHLEEDGYMLFHGGFTSQESEAIDDLCSLDLAPAMQRPFQSLPLDEHWSSYGEITSVEAKNGRQDRDAMLQRMLLSLSEADESTRRGLASQMMGQLIANGGIGSRAFLMLSMVANGSAVFSGSDGAEDDDDDDEECSDSS